LDGIKAEKIVKDYSGFKALKGVSFKVELGEFFGVFGPNGAGKTTLLKVLTGQIEPTSGNVTVLGYQVKNQSLEIKKRVGIVPEFESPPSFLTGQEFLEFVCDIRGLKDSRDRIDHWIDFFDLKGKDDIVCKDLSKGQRQKVMLASAFIHEPSLLFLDEPFINLDPFYQKIVREYLMEYVKKGNTVFLCTHILEIADKLCDSIMFINKGKVVEKGKKEKLTSKYKEGLEGMYYTLMSKDGGKD
jgi:ABC-2 type transport system ATP-binding protein